jgi:hypothetical protein
MTQRGHRPYRPGRSPSRRSPATPATRRIRCRTQCVSMPCDESVYGRPPSLEDSCGVNRVKPRRFVGPSRYSRAALTAVTVASRPEFSVNVWTCRPDGPSWSGPDCPAAARLVLVRAGRFQRRGSGGPVDLDPTVGYLGVPDEEEHFAHPHGGDACTSVQLRESSWARLVGDPGRPRGSAVYVDARLELAHRRLTAAVPGDVDYQLAEAVLHLVARALSAAADRPTPVVGRRMATDRRLVERARAAIHDDHPAARGLFPLADVAGLRRSGAPQPDGA